jgi:hypothetical protein
LKVRFARPRHFYENLKQRHLPKIGTFVAPRDCDAVAIAPDKRSKKQRAHDRPDIAAGARPAPCA